jgi:hypothetical protein
MCKLDEGKQKAIIDLRSEMRSWGIVRLASLVLHAEAAISLAPILVGFDGGRTDKA